MKNEKKFIHAIIIIIIIVNLACSVIFIHDKITYKEEPNHFTLFIGLNDKDANKQIINSFEAKNIVENITLKYVDSFTVNFGKGYWLNNNITYNESTIILYIDDSDINTIHKIANEIKEKLNQESILIETSKVKKEFY